MTEIWKSIKGYEGYYEVSNLGNVRSLDRINKTKTGTRKTKGIKLVSAECGGGYLGVTLCKDGSRKTKHIHRLVSRAFHVAPSDMFVVNHKDGNRLNNRYDNLEWVTQQQNCRHAWNNGLSKVGKIQMRNITKMGKDSGKTVICTITGKTYKSARLASESIGVNYKTLMNKLNGHRPNNTTLIYK